MTFEGTTYNDLKISAGEFFRATKDSSDGKACELGVKAFTLLYLAVDQDILPDHEKHEITILFEMVSKRATEVEMRWLMNQ